MSDKKITQTEVMIRLDEKMLEVLRRIDTFDKVIVPRSEFTIVIEELRAKHMSNQRDIEEVQQDLRGLMYKLGFGLGSLQVITAIAMYLITRGA
jgi:hypothetical protein